jgi:uncharacterized membrane protein AbrB (regulator of aidB expression)
MSDELKKRSAFWLIVSSIIGAFVTFWLSFGALFSYPTPLPDWMNPFVFAPFGATIGFLIAKAILRRGERGK